MDVSIIDKRLNSKVYCKTDHFPFQVISLPFLNSNLDNILCYHVFFSQALRFQRLCTFRTIRCDFEARIKFLTSTLTARDYKFSRLRHGFWQVIDKYISEFLKWEIPINFGQWFNRINSNFNKNSIIAPFNPVNASAKINDINPMPIHWALRGLAGNYDHYF